MTRTHAHGHRPVGLMMTDTILTGIGSREYQFVSLQINVALTQSGHGCDVPVI